MEENKYDNQEERHYQPNGHNTESVSIAPGKYRVIRRNGKLTEFNLDKIHTAMTKAFLAEEGGTAASSARVHELVDVLSNKVATSLFRRMPDGGTFNIESIQDQVELALMRAGEHSVAKRYIFYREQRTKERVSNATVVEGDSQPQIQVLYSDGRKDALDVTTLENLIYNCAVGLEDVNPKQIIEDTIKNLYNNVPEVEVYKSAIMSAKSLIELEPNYSYLAARLLLKVGQVEAYKELNILEPHGFSLPEGRYKSCFKKSIQYAIENRLLDSQLAKFDLDALAKHLDEQRDLKFTYLGLQTLYDRYLIHNQQQRIELPQAFFMRVSMGLALYEKKEKQQEYAIKFYEMLSSFRFMSSTPTLFNSGTLRPQLSSCYLTTISDDLASIYDGIKENALLSKYAGGLGNDWTQVRSMGSHIKGTNGNSQGVVPFMKVANDTAIAVNQGGKRKGAVCAYLETWHLDIEGFLELRKNTGDERRRTHDMNTANWIPDLFMKRVHEQKDWTLFSPHEVPDLHDSYGLDFEKHYVEYEKKAKAGQIKNWKSVPAQSLWVKMLSMLYETGHPWITFKDACNIRSPQQHAGVVHSSNLCTEITLNTNEEEIAVCNLGSINLSKHFTENGLDIEKIKSTIDIAIRMLDNVIEYNYYSVDKAKTSNLKHRPIGMGIMAFSDYLYHLRVPYDSSKAVEIADKSMELISYYAISASMELAKERGKYSSYEGSLWSKGILPIDSLELLEKERVGYLDIDKSSTLDWSSLRKKIKKHGVRNSNILAIAPTATIANICGVTASIEPTYQNLYVKSNLSGEFTLVNPYLVKDLKKLKLWDEVMVNDLKYFDGSLAKIDRIPDELKLLYRTSFDIDQRWIVECAARRQKWLDQSQSLNLYWNITDGKKLSDLYKLAWVRGIKTTYYLRTIGASHIEKTTLDSSRKNQLNQVSQGNQVAQQCLIEDPDCEACQ